MGPYGVDVGSVPGPDILSWKYIIPENIAITAPKESTKWKWIVEKVIIFLLSTVIL